MNAKYETHEHDVLIIGAGGAGLRAAIEALSQGASVGVVCKSLLGKAHTVMAEGGIAAAMGNVDSADDWRTHFRDTMQGDKFLNNWRMAQIHAQEAPERLIRYQGLVLLERNDVSRQRSLVEVATDDALKSLPVRWSVRHTGEETLEIVVEHVTLVCIRRDHHQ